MRKPGGPSCRRVDVGRGDFLRVGSLSLPGLWRCPPKQKSLFRPSAALLILLFVAGAPASSADLKLEKHVLPILNRYCFQCHGEAVQMGDLDLRTRQSMLRGGSKGPALVMGSPQGSLLYQRMLDGSMPLGDARVSDAETRTIHDWIQAGSLVEKGQETDAEAGKMAHHWAFRPPKRPAQPRISDQTWVGTPVDAFILARLEDKSIQPAPPADRSTLLRRIYLNLIGLPPSPHEQRAFLEDKSPQAYEKVVEDLLSRPRYGERWARHWLDVVRYAETNGYERDGTKPSAWRYRDYVIDAFNKDKPFNRFLLEQLAGDEISGSNAETQIAATFLRLGTWDDEPAEALRDRYEQLDDVLGTTATAFLGLTLRCARCHDHKFEPFTQRDYYRMLAVFEPLKRPQDKREVLPTELDVFVGTEEELAAYSAATETANSEIVWLEGKIEEVRKVILKRLFAAEAEALGMHWLQHAETVLAFQTAADKRTEEQKKLVQEFSEKLDQQIRQEAQSEERSQLEGWEKRIEDIQAGRPKPPPRGYIWREEGSRTSPTYLLERGDPDSPGDQIRPGFPAILSSASIEPPQPTRRSSGRRAWLAGWMTRRDNPLVARVIVNRIWQWHFGEGLVASENDFGVMGRPPSHPDLLDYLATALVDSGWSIKHIQRLIVESNTFRMSSMGNEQAAAIDPDNVLLWGWKPRRLEGEVIRDSMLAVSGQLNLEMGGPSVYPPLPQAVLAGLPKPESWGQSDEQQARRRSVYIFVKRTLAVPELELLDTPDSTSSCEQRVVSTTGPQALVFINGDFTHEQARHLASRLEREVGDDVRARVSRAFQLVFGRKAGVQELEAALQFLKKQRRQIEADGALSVEGSNPERAALEAFCLVLLNTNEFFYLS